MRFEEKLEAFGGWDLISGGRLGVITYIFWHSMLAYCDGFTAGLPC
jgi:hypothetical protein